MSTSARTSPWQARRRSGANVPVTQCDGCAALNYREANCHAFVEPEWQWRPGHSCWGRALIERSPRTVRAYRKWISEENARLFPRRLADRAARKKEARK